VRKGRGALLALPDIDIEDEDFITTRTVDKKEQNYWTKSAQIFGKKLTSTLVAIADALASEVVVTPSPDWVKDNLYRIPEEVNIEKEIEDTTAQLVKLEEKRRELGARLKTAGSLRSLLYEQGKPLEHAVLEALCLFGFDATGFRQDGSEFDAVFSSPEGRFIGEVEGKDNRVINIDKFSQLERNINEDFERDEVSEHAKGVLFGNAFRLQPIQSRGEAFTDKCKTAAKRVSVALVNIPDLFVPCRYLKTNRDPEYARRCREAIFHTAGDIVSFPVPQNLDEIPTDAQVEEADVKAG
jgi:hypothetical protein